MVVVVVVVVVVIALLQYIQDCGRVMSFGAPWWDLQSWLFHRSYFSFGRPPFAAVTLLCYKAGARRAPCRANANAKANASASANSLLCVAVR